MHVVDQIIALLCEATFASPELPRTGLLDPSRSDAPAIAVLEQQLACTFDFPVSVAGVPGLDEGGVRSLADAVGRFGGMPGSVVELAPSHGATTLFCLGGVEQYRPLAAALPPGQGLTALFVAPEVVSVLGGRPVAPNVEALADLYVDGLRAVQPSGPYVLCGFSFAGLVAYEAARQLTAKGEEVRLALIDVLLPRGYKKDRRAWFTSWLVEAARDPGALFARAKQRREKKAAAASRASTSPVGAIYGPHFQVSALGAAREGICAGALARYDAEDHRYGGDVLFVQATEEPLGAGVYAEDAYGFSDLVDGDVRCVKLASGHLALLQEPTVTAVAASLAHLLV